MSNNRIIITGGDGFCGWPTSLYLSEREYDITIVDNLSRRKIDVELGCESLTPIKPIEGRLETWKKVMDKNIRFEYIDVADHYHRVLELIREIKPRAIIHFAEQRAAPFSMKSSYHKRYTINNNINATHNILCAIVESGQDIHLVHIGSAGVYGYSTVNMPIPEGYLPVKFKTDDGEREMEIVYPSGPGSIYHMSKCMDIEMFQYFNKNDNVRVTDLEQGIIWGTQTEETRLHEDLVNRFDYEGNFGTVLNKFLMQAAVGHPLTVHGVGGQTRAFIHIQDSVKCVRMAIENPPEKSERVKIFNQTSECLNILGLAKKISRMTGARIRYYINPRNESPRNDLKFVNEGFKNLGWNPIMLDDNLLIEVNEIAKKYSHRCDMSKIICTSTWRDDIPVDLEGSEKPIE